MQNAAVMAAPSAGQTRGYGAPVWLWTPFCTNKNPVTLQSGILKSLVLPWGEVVTDTPFFFFILSSARLSPARYKYHGISGGETKVLGFQGVWFLFFEMGGSKNHILLTFGLGAGLPVLCSEASVSS